MASATLLANTAGPLPLPLLSQFVPDLVGAVRCGEVAASGAALVAAKVRWVAERYLRACSLLG